MKVVRLLIVAGIIAAVLMPIQNVSAHHADVPILVYHHISKGRTRWHLSPAKFEQQLAFLASQGYRTISLSTYLDSIQKGTALPDKPIVLTFDDGNRDNFDTAFPLLKKYGMTGTFFIVTGQVGQPGSMTWEQIAALRQAGMEIGAHTVHHPFLTRLLPLRAFGEMLMSRLELIVHLHAPIDLFAYPYNDHNWMVVALAHLAGFRAACIVGAHKYDIPGDLFEIPRSGVLAGERMKIFALVVGDRP